MHHVKSNLTLNPSKQLNKFKELISEMNGVDLVVISSGVGFINHDLQWTQEKETIDVNISGFTAMANVAIHHFVCHSY